MIKDSYIMNHKYKYSLTKEDLKDCGIKNYKINFLANTVALNTFRMEITALTRSNKPVKTLILNEDNYFMNKPLQKIIVRFKTAVKKSENKKKRSDFL